MKKVQQARLITLEGIEGAGKTTHLATIQDFLHEQDIDSIATHEPGATPLGQIIREWLLSTEYQVSTDTEIGLLFADRAEHINKVVLPGLRDGKWVISDRFSDASLAYQGGGRGIPQKLIQNLISYICRNVSPDLTLLLDIDPENAAQRVTQRGGKDRFESEDIAFFERVQAVYKDLAKQEPQRWRIVDANNDIASTKIAIKQILTEFIAELS